VLLRAFALIKRQLPEAKLIICGEGPERQKITNLIAELELNESVSMLGFLHGDETKQVFGRASLVAIPSIWEEPFGLVAAEAMMMGRPVVASRTGGLPEVVEDGHTGFLVTPKDEEALATALLRLLCNRELANQMGAAGRRIALAQFTEENVTKGFLEVYQRLLDNRAHPQ